MEGLGRLFVQALPDPGSVVLLESLLGHDAAGSSAEIDELLDNLASRHPSATVTGFAHFAASRARDSAGPAASAEADALDRLRQLALLSRRLAPLMQASGRSCRIVTVTSEDSLQSPSSWPRGQAMRALAEGFVEQYTEALAEELQGSGVTVYGVRTSRADEALGLAGPEGAAALAAQLAFAWALPGLEVHGRIVPLQSCQPPVPGNGASSIRGGSVLGPSIDARWALRAAAGRAAEYPPDARPAQYAELARALRVAEDGIVWCHGASDVIVRIATVAATRFRQAAGGAALSSHRPRALVQAPTWPNAEGLLRNGGMVSLDSAPYPDPWQVGGREVTHVEAADVFWGALQKEVLSDNPPALVYMVHPHFPTGHKDPRFGERLEALSQRSAGRTLFAVDQTYLNFTDPTEDDHRLERLAASSGHVALVRSLSKVEGLAALRLGYALATPGTARELTGCLPFSGGLYISEVALAAAVASLCGAGADRHRRAVLHFYREEQAWFCDQLSALGLRVSPSPCPFFCIRAPLQVLDRAVKKGAALQVFYFPEATAPSAPPLAKGEGDACCLVSDRAANAFTVEALRQAIAEEEEATRARAALPSWMPSELLRPFVGG